MRKKIIEEKAQKREEKELYKKKRNKIKTKNPKKAMVRSMIIMQQCDKARFGERYDELDRVADLGRDEFPRSENHAYDVINMEENRLIDRHTKYMGKFTSENNSKITNGALQRKKMRYKHM